METVKIKTSQHVDIDYPVAGLGERLVARLIDLGMFLSAYFFVLLASASLINNNSVMGWVIIILLGAAYIFYNLLCEMFMDGQSVGKRIMKIKVVSLDGGQPGFGQYFIRWIFRLVDFVLTGQVLGLVFIVITEKKQRLGDVVAGTTLIKTISHTRFNHIAFHPVEEGYIPVFPNVNQLNDSDIELLHEVIHAFYKTSNFQIIHALSVKVSGLIGAPMPQHEDELNFLKTVAKDYNHVTSLSE